MTIASATAVPSLGKFTAGSFMHQNSPGGGVIDPSTFPAVDDRGIFNPGVSCGGAKIRLKVVSIFADIMP